MNYWGIQWKEWKRKLVKIPPSKRADFLVCVIFWTRNMLGIEWLSGIPDRNRKLFEQCGRACRDGTKVEASVFEEFEELIEETQYPGLYDIGTALMICLRRKGTAIEVEQIRDVLGYCYQAVLSLEIISKIERPMIEDQIIEMEKRNARCVGMIDKQFDLLLRFQKAEKGQESMLDSPDA